MNNLLKVILSLSLSGTLLILVFLLCAPLVKDRLGKAWQYYIWLVVAARLLIPFAPEANLMGTLFHQLDRTAIQADADRLETREISPDGNFAGGDRAAERGTPRELASQDMENICLLVWFTAAVGLFIRKVTVYQSFVKYINAGRGELPDMGLWERAGKLVEQTGVKRAVRVYTNGLISSPLLVGFFRPCIMLPSAKLPDSDFDYTMLHELTHYKRRDMFYKWLVQITICIHWFNPLVYLMGRAVSRACELACDEAVIKSLDAAGRRAYGDTLLNAMDAGGAYKDSLASVTLRESEKRLKERLDAIMKFKKPSKSRQFAAGLLTLSVCLGAMFTGVYAAPGPAPEQNSVTAPEPSSITPAQADEMALALTNKIWVWDWVAFFVPYMSAEGVDSLLPAAESSEWAGYVDWNTGKPLNFTQAQIDGARKANPEKPFLTKADIDAHAQMIMQFNGQWGCVDFMFPYMTDKGIARVKKTYAEKHGGAVPNDFDGVQEAVTAPDAADGFDYTAFLRLETLTPAQADALALSYIKATGQFGHVYNIRPYMTEAGIGGAVKAYLDAGGDAGDVLAILPAISEAAKGGDPR